MRPVAAPLPPALAERSGGDGSRHSLAACAVLVVLVLAIYAQVRTHQFLNYDDGVYVTNNAHVLAGLTGDGVRWAFTNVDAANWHPLTWLSHELDLSILGRDAGRQLLENVALHALNVLLLFLWLKLATGAFWRSGIVAALFAVHPLHVESVAWVAERKDVLSTFFMLLALHGYTRWVRDRSRAGYGVSVAALALGLLAKPMLVTFPFALLLLDYWPFPHSRSLRMVVLDKLPFIACTIPSIVMTLRAQQVAMAGVNVPLAIRLANASIAYVKYLFKTIWPSSLALAYPYPTTIRPVQALVCSLLLVAITAGVILARRKMPWLPMGWLWFVGTLVPVIGIVQVGQQSMADRYTYIPHIGLFIGVVWTVSALVHHNAEFRYPAVATTAALLLTLSVVAYIQTGYWHDSVTLFEHAIAVDDDNRVAHLNLGAALLDRGQPARAETEIRAAAGYQPSSIQHMDLALALGAQSKFDEAAREAEAAVSANPSSPEALGTYGTVQLKLGHYDEAAGLFDRAARIRNDSKLRGQAAFARAQARAAQGNDAAAAAEYASAVKLDPSLYDAHMNFGALLSRTGRVNEAIQQFSDAATIHPDSPEPLIYLSLAESNEKHFSAAADDVARAIAVDHDGANRFLTTAIRMTPRPTAIDEYLQYLRQQAGVR